MLCDRVFRPGRGDASPTPECRVRKGNALDMGAASPLYRFFAVSGIHAAGRAKGTVEERSVARGLGPELA